jgi:DNA-directed RNA polymerase subunit RPC12/RpoP
MPHHEFLFLCQDCKRQFSKVLTVAEHEEGSIACPHCGSSKVEQPGSPFYTSEKSRSSVQQNSIPPSHNEDSRERASSSASEEDDRARVLSDGKEKAALRAPKKKPDPHH